jgi:hypothetical protein
LFEVPGFVFLYLIAGAAILLSALAAAIAIRNLPSEDRLNRLRRFEEQSEKPLLFLALSILPLLIQQFVIDVGEQGVLAIENAL